MASPYGRPEPPRSGRSPDCGWVVFRGLAAAALEARLAAPKESDLPRDVAGEGQQRAHQLVARVRGRAEHAGAAAVDDHDPVTAPVVGGLLGDAPAAGSAVHPHVCDSEL